MSGFVGDLSNEQQAVLDQVQKILLSLCVCVLYNINLSTRVIQKE